MFVAPPTVTRAPPNESLIRQGETVEIICEAIGVPAPLIVWRLNWGHTAPAPRVTSTTEKLQDTSAWGQSGIVVSRGKITIRQARVEDEGAYTCEAINSKGTIFAVPDTILYVKRKCKFGIVWLMFKNSVSNCNSLFLSAK